MLAEAYFALTTVTNRMLHIDLSMSIRDAVLTNCVVQVPVGGRWQAPCRSSPAVVHARNLGAAAKAEAPFESALEEATDTEELAQEVVPAGSTLEVDAASVADESLKIVNCNLSDSTVKACFAITTYLLLPCDT